MAKAKEINDNLTNAVFCRMTDVWIFDGKTVIVLACLETKEHHAMKTKSDGLLVR